MPRIPPLLAQAVLLALIACATAWAWLHYTGAAYLTPGAAIVCALASVAVEMAVESVVRWARRGRSRRAHARPRPDTRKAL